MHPSTEDPGWVVHEQAPEPGTPLPPFLAGVAQEYLGNFIAVHTERKIYSGKLLSITPICVTLYTDSDAFEQPVRVRIDSTRIVAIEVLA
jgi:hypothetical protein